MIDNATTAAKDFYKAVREFSQRTKAWEQAIFYQTTPDEAWDITLISRRAYGNPHETLAVMASAGLDTVDSEMPIKLLTLPTVAQLYQIKRRTGFESQSDYRQEGQPTWA